MEKIIMVLGTVYTEKFPLAIITAKYVINIIK